MSETYEDVMRRIEPKNYTVLYTSPAGAKQRATSFTSLEAAQFHAEQQVEDGMLEVRIYRAGKHPSGARQATPSLREKSGLKQNTKTGELYTNDEAWALPEGYVDGDADKHGPVVVPKTDNRLPARSPAEKAEWARTNRKSIEMWTDNLIVGI